jgi:hypothetical protein
MKFLKYVEQQLYLPHLARMCSATIALIVLCCAILWTVALGLIEEYPIISFVLFACMIAESLSRLVILLAELI